MSNLEIPLKTLHYEKDDMIHIGEKLKEIASAKGIKVDDLAHKMGLSTKIVYEHYKKNHLNTEVLEKYSKVLEIPISSFFGYTYEAESPIVNEGKYEYTIQLQRKYIEKLEKENEELSKKYQHS